jgi:thiol-disulfide isomerase/thioredoxin
MKTQFAYILLLFISYIPLKAQIITLQGLVNDKKTQASVPYVNIGIIAYSIGTTTNDEGEFILKIPVERQQDTVVFSCVGYTSFKIKAADLVGKTVIALQSAEINLAEITVKAVNAEKIIQDVLKNRVKNYGTDPSLMQVFCREIVKEEGTNNYFIESEGVLEMYKSSVKKNNDQVRLIKGRKKNLPPSFTRDTNIYTLPKIMNGPTIGMLVDIIKRPDYFIVQTDQFSFNHEGYDYINDRLMYKISFKPQKAQYSLLMPSDVPFYEGTIYVDTESLALVRTVFTLTKTGLTVSNRQFNKENMPLIVKYREYTVNYVLAHDKWHFHSGIVENKYNFYPDLMKITSKVEFLVTGVKTTDVKQFSKAETISAEDMLVDKINDFDDSFWGDFNFIKSNNRQDSARQVTLTTPSVSKPKQSLAPLKTYISTNDVQFFKGSFENIQKAATETGKHIFIDVYANWCKPCKQMDAEVFHDKEIADKMNAFFINYKADSESTGRGIAIKHSVQALPTTLILDENGIEQERFRGYSGIARFNLQIDKVIQRLPKGLVFLKVHESFKKGKRDLPFLVLYAQIRKSLGLSNDILTDAAVRELPLDTLKQMPYQQFLLSQAHDLNTKTFEFLVENKDVKLFEYKLSMLIKENFTRAVEYKDKNLLKQVLKANTRVISNPSVSETENARLMIDFNEKTKEKQ